MSFDILMLRHANCFSSLPEAPAPLHPPSPNSSYPPQSSSKPKEEEGGGGERKETASQLQCFHSPPTCPSHDPPTIMISWDHVIMTTKKTFSLVLFFESDYYIVLLSLCLYDWNRKPQFLIQTDLMYALQRHFPPCPPGVCGAVPCQLLWNYYNKILILTHLTLQLDQRATSASKCSAQHSI